MAGRRRGRRTGVAAQETPVSVPAVSPPAVTPLEATVVREMEAPEGGIPAVLAWYVARSRPRTEPPATPCGKLACTREFYEPSNRLTHERMDHGRL